MKDVNSFIVHEEDNLQLICEVPLGHNFKDDAVIFRWFRRFDNGSETMINDFNITLESAHDGPTYGQATFHLKRSYLHLPSVEYSDRALHICEASNGPFKANKTVRLRVKWHLEALYPLLGICGEVFVLCVINLI